MSLGDRPHPLTPLVPRSAYHPETQARGEVLAGALGAAYSYGQQADNFLAWWVPTQNNESLPFLTLTAGGTLRLLNAPADLGAHFDRVVVSAWVALGTLTGESDLQLNVNAGGSAASVFLPTDADPTLEGIASDTLPDQLWEMVCSVDLTSGGPTSIVVDLTRAEEAQVFLAGCSAWAETD